jgi:hypothetical protein
MRLPMTSAEYEGEFIIHETRIEAGKRVEDREWVPRTLINDDHRGYAVVIGNGISREKFKIDMLGRHKGGLFASMRCQTYGCNALYRDFSPSFLVAHNPAIAQEVVDSGYADENIVYSSAQQLVKHPSKFHLIPQNINMNAGAIATYLACFDQHKHIYLIGFDNQRDPEINNNVYAGTEHYAPFHSKGNDGKWIKSMEKLFGAYPDIDFVWVNNNPDHNFPDAWKWYKNVRKIKYPQFISELDIG